uniref:Uncharacterized protein n=1 Tax=Oryza glumipatula TaxID=40148 RepID=A0A0E0A9N1_9ORYZ
MGGSSDKYGWRLLITDVTLSVGSRPFSADLPPQAMASRSAPQKTRGRPMVNPDLNRYREVDSGAADKKRCDG